MAQIPVSPTVSAGFAHAFVEFAAGRGAQRAKLLSACGPGLAELDDPDARVPLGAFRALVRAGKTLTGDPALPLEFGAATDLRHFSIAGLIAHNAATMAEALVQLNRYGRLVADVEGVGELVVQVLYQEDKDNVDSIEGAKVVRELHMLKAPPGRVDLAADFGLEQEAVDALTGVLPIRLGKRIEWDSAAMKATNAPEADPMIRKTYRKGFELPV